jgi:hypothetical protein
MAAVESPRRSVSGHFAAIGLTNCSARRILHKVLNVHPYKIAICIAICIGEEKESLKFDSGEEIKPSTECTYLGTKID